MTQPDKRGDSFTSLYILLFLPFVAIDWIDWLAPTWDWWTIGLVTFVATGLIAVGLFVVNLGRWRWRRVLSLMTAPVLLLALIQFLVVVSITPDNLRFSLTEHEYLAVIGRIDVPRTERRFKTFAWDSTFVGKTYSTLVYDESDEIALPKGDQSAAWQQRNQSLCSKLSTDCVNLDPGSDEYISVRKIGDHFYILDDSFPNAFP